MSAPEYCLLWINRDWGCMSRSDWAAWVQALGAVVAVAAAIFVSWLQLRTARRLEHERTEEARRARFFAIDALAAQARAVTDALQKNLNGGRAGQVALGDLQLLLDCKANVLGLPTFDIPDPRLVLVLQGLAWSLQRLHDAWVRRLQTIDVVSNGDLTTGVNEVLSHVSKIAEICRRGFDTHAGKR
jgi:hypothetical protein